MTTVGLVAVFFGFLWRENRAKRRRVIRIRMIPKMFTTWSAVLTLACCDVSFPGSVELASGCTVKQRLVVGFQKEPSEHKQAVWSRLVVAFAGQGVQAAVPAPL